MRGFSGRLAAQPDPYFLRDATSATLFCTPTENGATCAIVGGAGLAEIPFLASPTDTAQPYDLSPFTGPGRIFDAWAINAGGVAMVGLVEWIRLFGVGNFGLDGFGSCAPPVLDVPFYGVPVNSAPVTLRFSDGSSLLTAQYQATFLGSICVSDGKISCHVEYDLARRWDIWNRHNQRQIFLKGGSTSGPADVATQLWQYSPAWAPFQANLDAYLAIFTGRPAAIDCRYQTGSFNYIGAPGMAAIVQGAIGWDSTDTPSGMWFGRSYESGNPVLCGATQQQAEYCNQNSVGAHKILPLIKTQGVLAGSKVNDGHSAIAMFNQELRMMLTAEWAG